MSIEAIETFLLSCGSDFSRSEAIHRARALFVDFELSSEQAARDGVDLISQCGGSIQIGSIAELARLRRRETSADRFNA